MKLDEAQETIVNSNANDIVVIAGAGSGKTRVLTERIQKLLIDGINPKSIVAITFTRMAAEEMQQRLASIEGADKVFIGTIHSFANMILHRHSNIVYQLLTDEAETYIVKRLCDDKLVPFSYNIYLDFKSQHYNSGEVYSYITSKYGFEKSKALRHVLEYDANDEYKTTVSSFAKSHNYITFDELIEQCTDYLNENNITIDYLFVDEFQDIGHLEYKFISSISAKHNFFVGDDYQAIYGFKGATDEYFKRLTSNEKSKYWTVYRLNNNYRCGNKIINFANKIISTILPYDEELKGSICKSGFEGRVKTIKDKSNIPSVIKFVKDDYKDWFVLCRTNKEVAEIMNYLDYCKIPNTTFKKAEMSLEEMKEVMNDSKVKVITAHSSKGLESKNVVIAYTNPLYDPRNRCKDGTIRSIEEIKLYYVSITRAMNNLYIFG